MYRRIHFRGGNVYPRSLSQEARIEFVVIKKYYPGENWCSGFNIRRSKQDGRREILSPVHLAVGLREEDVREERSDPK